MSDSDRVHWDRRYRALPSTSVDEPTAPAAFAPYADVFPTAGHGVELACGRGTAAVWLAQRGVDVLGVDVSPVAVAYADALADRAEVAHRCRFVVADLDDGLPAGPPADVVMCHMFRDARLDAAIVDRLAPGGLLAISVLSEVGACPGAFRARAGELTATFAALSVVADDERDGRAWLLARKKHPAN